MLVKESKIRVLENFYGVDYALLGKPVSEASVCCPFLTEEYLSTKGALMSCLVEMYKEIEHSPKATKTSIKESDLHLLAKKSAKVARENAKLSVGSEKGRARIKKAVSEALQISKKQKKVNIDSIVKNKTQLEAFVSCLDSMLIGRALKESKNPTALKETWTGKILKEAYLSLRTALAESAIEILENKI